MPSTITLRVYKISDSVEQEIIEPHELAADWPADSPRWPPCDCPECR